MVYIIYSLADTPLPVGPVMAKIDPSEDSPRTEFSSAILSYRLECCCKILTEDNFETQNIILPNQNYSISEYHETKYCCSLLSMGLNVSAILYPIGKITTTDNHAHV